MEWVKNPDTFEPLDLNICGFCPIYCKCYCPLPPMKVAMVAPPD